MTKRELAELITSFAHWDNALCDCCGFDTFYSDFAITEKG